MNLSQQKAYEKTKMTPTDTANTAAKTKKKNSKRKKAKKGHFYTLKFTKRHTKNKIRYAAKAELLYHEASGGDGSNGGKRRKIKVVKELNVHPKTKDPLMTRSIADKISQKLSFNSNESDIYRENIYNSDGKHMATVVYAHYDVLDAVMMMENANKNNERESLKWERGDSHTLFSKFNRLVSRQPTQKLKKLGKWNASGLYAEVGFGSGAGRHNSSFALNKGDKKSRAHLPYARNADFSNEVEHDLASVQALSVAFLKHRFPELAEELKSGSQLRYGGDKKRRTGDCVAKALNFPHPPTSGKLKDMETVPSHQCAIRVSGGSGLHTDSMDPTRKYGLLSLYSCFAPRTPGKRNDNYNWETPLKENDLLCFGRPDGGKAACIQTMHPCYVCFVFSVTSNCHGTVFDDDVSVDGLKQLKENPRIPGVSGNRIVTYPIKNIDKIIAHCYKKSGGDEALENLSSSLENMAKTTKFDGMRKNFNHTLKSIEESLKK